jgi:hypothetical protein
VRQVWRDECGRANFLSARVLRQGLAERASYVSCRSTPFSDIGDKSATYPYAVAPMKRPRPRTLAILALAAVGSVGFTILVSAEEGCVFSSPESGAASICNAIGAYFQTCAVSSSCAAAFSRDCTRVSSALSESALNAAFLCEQAGISCGDAGTALVSACLVSDGGFLNAFSPSTAQQRLAQDYCSACSPGDTGCAAGFYGSPARGAGLTSLELAGDPTVQSIDSQCTPHLSADAGAAACLETFQACAMPIAAAGLYIPPECVNDAGLGTSPDDGG